MSITPTNPLQLIRQLVRQVIVQSPSVNTAIVMPAAANMLGNEYSIVNTGTANLLVQASDASLIVTVQPGTAALVTPTSDTPVTNAAWAVSTNGVNASGIKGNTSPGTTSATAFPASGYIGQYLENNASGAISLTSATAVSIDSGGGTPVGITLGAGCWDISGACYFNPTNAAHTTAGNLEFNTFVGTQSGNFSTGRDLTRNSAAWAGTGTTAVNNSVILALPPWRVVLTANQQYFLQAIASFTSGTVIVTGTLRATKIA